MDYYGSSRIGLKTQRCAYEALLQKYNRIQPSYVLIMSIPYKGLETPIRLDGRR